MNDIPTIRQKAEEYERLRGAAIKGPWTSAWKRAEPVCIVHSAGGDFDFIDAARNSTIAADVLRLCEEVERLRALLELPCGYLGEFAAIVDLEGDKEAREIGEWMARRREALGEGGAA